MHTLLSLRGRYTPAMANLAHEGILYGADIKITLRCIFHLHFRSIIIKQSQGVESIDARVSCNPPQASAPSKEDATAFFDRFSLKCPRCNQTRSNSHIWPRSGARWVDIPCTARFCTLSAPAHQWRCNCNISWQACSLHSCWPDMCAAFFPAANNIKNKLVRPRPLIPSVSFNILHHISRKATRASGSNPPSAPSGLVRLPGRQRVVTGTGSRKTNPGAVCTKEYSRTEVLQPSHFFARALTPKLAAKFPRLCKDLSLGELHPHGS
jgi:hypothetical protein